MKNINNVYEVVEVRVFYKVESKVESYDYSYDNYDLVNDNIWMRIDETLRNNIYLNIKSKVCYFKITNELLNSGWDNI